MSLTNSDKSYKIETKVSHGFIEDPITGESHTIESYEDKRGGTIEVDRPDSAKYIVDSGSRMSFVSKAPTEKAVKEAQRQEFDFAGSAVCESFASRRSETLGGQDLSKSDGFDPATDPAYNDPRLKTENTYQALIDSGYDDEAGYLRALPSVDKQEAFVTFLRESGEVDL